MILIVALSRQKMEVGKTMFESSSLPPAKIIARIKFQALSYDDGIKTNDL